MLMKNFKLYLITLIFNGPNLCAAEAKDATAEHHVILFSRGAFKPITHLGAITHPSFALQHATDLDFQDAKAKSKQEYNTSVPGIFKPIKALDPTHILPHPSLYFKEDAERILDESALAKWNRYIENYDKRRMFASKAPKLIRPRPILVSPAAAVGTMDAKAQLGAMATNVATPDKKRVIAPKLVIVKENPRGCGCIIS